MNNKIAFNTANLVGQFTDWRFKLSEWGEQDRLTVESFGEAEFRQMCGKIADAGFNAVELWRAHVDPSRTDDAQARRYREMLDEHALEPVALAGPLTADTARICRALGVPRCCGGYWGNDRGEVERLMAETDIEFCYENHPEKSVQEIREQVLPGGGVALDTGWLGTQGIDAPDAVRELGPLVRHVHLKDVKAPGGHETTPLGQGCVNVEGVIDALRSIGYQGVLSWEDEPEDRNPYDIAADMRKWIEQRLAS